MQLLAFAPKIVVPRERGTTVLTDGFAISTMPLSNY